MSTGIAFRMAACTLSMLTSACVALPVAPPQIELAQAGEPVPVTPTRSAAYPPNYIECMRDPLRAGCPGTAELATMDAAPPVQQAPATTPSDPAQAGRVLLGVAAIALATFAVSFGLGRALSSSLYRIPPISEWPRR